MQEEVFHEVADEFIHLANQLSEDWATPMLSAAFMYAAARYNVFHLVDGAHSDSEHRQRTVEYLCEQYRRMIEENLVELSQATLPS